MDVILKKYFWVVTLVAIALCAGLAGRAGSHLVEQMVFMGDETQAASPQRRPYLPSPSERPRGKETNEIIRRNIFCSVCAPITPGGENASEPTSLDLTPQRSSLQLELVSTMVVPTDERWSMAVVRDNASPKKDPGLYAAGSRLPGGDAEVLRIVEKKVYLRNGNRIEYIELEGAAPPPPPSHAPTPAVAMASGEADGEIGNHVRCNGSACEIDRSLVDQMLSNTTSLATAARFVPSIKDGRPNGFKLYAIRPSSIFGRIGLQNGDTVKAINGMEMNSPDQALGVYTKVRNASHLTVLVDRRGETVTLDYTIR